MMALDKVDIGELVHKPSLYEDPKEMAMAMCCKARFASTFGAISSCTVCPASRTLCLQADGVKIKLDPQSPFDREYKGITGNSKLH
eukprot:4487281-Amphidinium_carterae.1